MSVERDIDDLLDIWESLCERGGPPTTEAFIRDHGAHLPPDQAQKLAGRIARLERVDAVISNLRERDSGDLVGSQLAAVSEFRVISFHARGGMGEVYRAVDASSDREVAIKVLRPQLATTDIAQQRFHRESCITSQLQHPGIIPVYTLHADAATSFYAMRFVEGTTLDEAIRKLHACPNRRHMHRLLRHMIVVCHTIAFAHEQGYLHRDIKPANVLLGRHEETYVVDWGLSKRLAEVEDESAQSMLADVPDSLTQSDALLGTPSYMSPEQAQGRIRALAATSSDVFGLGATLYALLTGHPPFEGKSTGTTIDQAKENMFIRPRARNAYIPKPLEAICLKAMESQPERRYESAAELAKDLESWLAGEPVSAYPERWTRQLSRWLRRRAGVLLAASLSVSIGLVGVSSAAIMSSSSYSMGWAIIIIFIAAGCLTFAADQMERISQHSAEEQWNV